MNLNMIQRKIPFLTMKYFVRYRSGQVGRDFVELQDWPSNDLKSLLWTALDLKSRCKGQKESGILKGKHVTALLTLSDPFTQTVMGRAVSSLGGALTTIVDRSLENIDKTSMENLGRDLSTASDIILINSWDHSFASRVADGATVPTVSWHSERYATFQALADTMTILEHFNLLSPLTVSWVGPATSLFNAYLHILPRMKTNLWFCCNDPNSKCEISEEMMSIGIQNSIVNKTEFRECPSPKDAVFRTDVIVTTGHDIPSLALVKKHVDEASLEYIILHELPRGKSEIPDELFRSKHFACWKSRENLTWTTMAVLVNLTEEYRPLINQPKWELD